MVFQRPHLNLGYLPDEPHGVNGLPELIAFNAQHNAHHVFGLQSRAGEESEPRQITFLQLHEAVERCCAWLVAQGVTTGRREGEAYPKPVGVLLGSDITIYIYMAALLRIGAPVLCLSARLTYKAIIHLLQATSTSTLLQSLHVARLSKEVAQESGSYTVNLVDALGYEDFLQPDHPGHLGLTVPPLYIHKIRHELGAVIMHSSGTTGLPKPIYHAPSYLLVYAACHQMPERQEGYAYGVSTLPLYHGFGLLAPSLALSIGLPFVLPPASIIPTARSTLASLRRTNAGSMLSVPSILEDMLKMPELDALPILRKLEFIAIGGAPMKETVGEELVRNGVNLLNHWGATEIGAIALIQPIPADYDWHYLIPRSDINLEFQPIDISTRSYKLIGHPKGWDSPFYVQDALEMHPSYDPSTSSTHQVRILGRTDDLIVLATGEKVRPTMMEQCVAEHPRVKDALVFGEGRAGLGVIVELVESTLGSGSLVNAGTAEKEELIRSLEPFIERGNSYMDAHGKISTNPLNMIIVTSSSTKPLIRTDKGSLARKPNYAAFKEEIRGCYDAQGAEEEAADALFVPASEDDLSALRESIRDLVLRVYPQGTDFFVPPSGNEVDFFEVGMDSLQATRLRVLLQSALRKTFEEAEMMQGQATLGGEIASDFCFQNSSVEKLTRAVAAILLHGHGHPNGSVNGTGNGMQGGENEVAKMQREESRVQDMLAMVDKYVQELVDHRKTLDTLATSPPRTSSVPHGANDSANGVNGHSHTFANPHISSQSSQEGKIIVLTGSTGSLGSFLLSQLVADPSVSKVYCLNRPRSLKGGSGATAVNGASNGVHAAAVAWAHQLRSVKSRGITVDDWEKVVMLEAQTSHEALGLSGDNYRQLLSLTHVLHIAWPMDFNRNLSSFEPHVRAVNNLLRLCALAAIERSAHAPTPKRLIFASSIAVAGRHPLINPNGPGDVPELELDPRCTDEFGYPEAKWVCEQVLSKANEIFGAESRVDTGFPILKTSTVRIGQLTGPEGSGAWNENEHFPIIVRTSQMMKALPKVKDSLSWMPVNRAAEVILELLFSAGFRPIYHMENPSRQSWASILDGLASILGSPNSSLPIIPFDTWLKRAQALGADPSSNHALKVMQFLERDFLRMSSGSVILRTAQAKIDSPTMVRSTALDRKHLEEYVSYWRMRGFMTV